MRVMVILGTRPEAIKMCPLIKELKKRDAFSVTVCLTGQHREMCASVMSEFNITADVDLKVMREAQTLFYLTSSVLTSLEAVLSEYRPELVLVHGDTTTAFAASVAAFYLRIPVGHVEAGLRTGDLYEPFPEEFNRRAISVLADLNFAPTQAAADNLIREGVGVERIFVTGNTVVDALRLTVSEDFDHPIARWMSEGKTLLLTAHRRENRGETMRGMFGALRRVADNFPEARIVCPLHPSPEVREAAEELSGHPRIMLTDPLGVKLFHNILARAYGVVTDSGGLQEEAAALGVPALVTRRATERGEGIGAGGLRLIGTDGDVIFRAVSELLEGEKNASPPSIVENPFGDGFASRRVADVIVSKIKNK